MSHVIEAERFGPFILREPLGLGGMAEVNLAIDPRRTGVSRLVAIKRLHASMSSQSRYVDMFLDEARIASLVRHASACSVTSHGHDRDGRPYLAMDYLCGEPLHRVASRLGPSRDGTVPDRVALIVHILIEVAEALHALHELCDTDGTPLDAVHRDVSPSNIFLTCRGEVKLIDFGIVKAKRRRRSTRSGVVKGKIRYMAPEMIAGRDFDRRCDVWALGVVAWELLTGRRLFGEEQQHEAVASVMAAEIVAPHRRCSDVPAAIGEIVMKALARPPAQRHPSALAFAQALRQSQPSSSLGIDELLTQWFDHDSCCYQRTLERVDLPDAEGSSVEGGSGDARIPTPVRRRGGVVLSAVALVVALAALVVGGVMTEAEGAWLRAGIAAERVAAEVMRVGCDSRPGNAPAPVGGVVRASSARSPAGSAELSARPTPSAGSVERGEAPARKDYGF